MLGKMMLCGAIARMQNNDDSGLYLIHLLNFVVHLKDVYKRQYEYYVTKFLHTNNTTMT